MKYLKLFYRPSVLVVFLILIAIVYIDKTHTINNTLNDKKPIDILCMVLTTEKNILTRGIAVWKTWVRRTFCFYSEISACYLLKYTKYRVSSLKIFYLLVTVQMSYS